MACFSRRINNISVMNISEDGGITQPDHRDNNATKDPLQYPLAVIPRQEEQLCLSEKFEHLNLNDEKETHSLSSEIKPCEELSVYQNESATDSTPSQPTSTPAQHPDLSPSSPILKKSTSSVHDESQNPSSTSRPKLDRRVVSFSEINVREYDMTLGDHPSCSYGPPVSLDWNYVEDEPIPVDEYESNRTPRRSMRQMVLSFYHRKNILLHRSGVTEDELKRATKQVSKVKTQRQITRFFLPAMKLEEAAESAKRKVGRRIGSRKRLERSVTM